MSGYQRIAPGTYTLAMRSHGAPATAKPILSVTVRVAAGKAYTVAGIGRNANLALSIFEDQHVSPPPGQGRVRVISCIVHNAVGRHHNAEGTTVVDHAQFPRPRPTLRHGPGNGRGKSCLWKAAAPVVLPFDVAPGGVYSLVVLDGQYAGGIEAAVRQACGARRCCRGWHSHDIDSALERLPSRPAKCGRGKPSHNLVTTAVAVGT